jgi:hypothetical protein
MHRALLLIALAACATTSTPAPYQAPPYVIRQLSFVHGAPVGIDTDAGPFTTEAIVQAVEVTCMTYMENKGLESGSVIGWVEKYKPTIFLASNIDCAKAHNGLGECGGFIASDNSIHVRGHSTGCISDTSFVHMLLHYLIGVHTGAMDIEHKDPAFKEVEPVINLQLTQANPRCAYKPATGQLQVTGTIVR